MIEVKTLKVVGLEEALLAVRLPFSKATSIDEAIEAAKASDFDKTMALLSRLTLSGDAHAKASRGIIAYCLINAPVYWWCEMETHRMGHERLSSQSTMHVDAKGLSGEELVKFKSEMPMGKQLIKADLFSYQCLRNIYKLRKDHRLPEWHVFCDWIETLPHASELITVKPPAIQ